MVFKIRNPELLRGQTNDAIASAVKRDTKILILALKQNNIL